MGFNQAICLSQREVTKSRLRIWTRERAGRWVSFFFLFLSFLLTEYNRALATRSSKDCGQGHGCNGLQHCAEQRYVSPVVAQLPCKMILSTSYPSLSFSSSFPSSQNSHFDAFVPQNSPSSPTYSPSHRCQGCSGRAACALPHYPAARNHA